MFNFDLVDDSVLDRVKLVEQFDDLPLQQEVLFSAFRAWAVLG